jgi:predicted ATPase
MLPLTVQGLVLSRVAHLPPEQQLILKVASVIGPRFPFDVLHHALGRHISISAAQLRQHLQELAALDLTPLFAAGPSPVYVFKHIITRDVVYQALLFQQRRVLHASVAEALEEMAVVGSTQAPTLLAYHWQQAGKPDKARCYAGDVGLDA